MRNFLAYAKKRLQSYVGSTQTLRGCCSSVVAPRQDSRILPHLSLGYIAKHYEFLKDNSSKNYIYISH